MLDRQRFICNWSPALISLFHLDYCTYRDCSLALQWQHTLVMALGWICLIITDNVYDPLFGHWKHLCTVMYVNPKVMLCKCIVYHVMGHVNIFFITEHRITEPLFRFHLLTAQAVDTTIVVHRWGQWLFKYAIYRDWGRQSANIYHVLISLWSLHIHVICIYLECIHKSGVYEYSICHSARTSNLTYLFRAQCQLGPNVWVIHCSFSYINILLMYVSCEWSRIRFLLTKWVLSIASLCKYSRVLSCQRSS